MYIVPHRESQSSTDTALSSEATTPTQAHGDPKIKHEHDIQENGMCYLLLYTLTYKAIVFNYFLIEVLK